MLSFGYYDDWKDKPLICPSCHWAGTSLTASEEDLTDGQGYCCPKCSHPEMLLVVLFPTPEEKRANWHRLSETEKKSLVKREVFLLDIEKRRLKNPNQLPDINLQSFAVHWDELKTNTGVDVVLVVAAEVIHSEPRTWEAAKHFGDVARILTERYGDRITDLVPSNQSELYLYGDDTSARDYVREIRAAMSSGQASDSYSQIYKSD